MSDSNDDPAAPAKLSPASAADGIAWIDDQFTPIHEAKISILDWGLLRSDATYDVVHVWNGRFFRLDAHIARFRNSADKLRLEIPVADAELKAILAGCVSRSGLDNAYVEMMLTRGMSKTMSRDPREATNRLICFAIPFGWIANDAQRERGLSVSISDVHRISPDSVDPTIKNYHWLDFVQALLKGYDEGYENVLMIDERGNVTEGPGFNIFIVEGGTVSTPSSGVLEGITRRTIIELCEENEIPIEVTEVSSDRVRAADEVFISSTAGGVMAVTRVDGRELSDGAIGPLTRNLTDAYWDLHAATSHSVAVAELLESS